MTLRTRIAITAAVAVALAFLIAAGGVYLATARTLRDEVDRSLAQIASRRLDLGRGLRPGTAPFGPRVGYLGGAGGFVQLIDSRGRVLNVVGAEPLPFDRRALDVATGRSEGFFATIETAGQPLRALTVPVPPGLAAQIARPLDEVEASLAALRNRLALGGVIAIGLAAGLGMLVARGAVRPVQRLTTLAEQVAATGDMTRRIEIPPGRDGDHDGDELHRLARTFNAMLANLEQARLAQQQLVADASHELRTPLTSLRTNIEVLALDAESQPDSGSHPDDADPAGRLSGVDRRRLLDDLTVQLDEFGRLVAALVELARGEQPAKATTSVRLDELVEAVTDRMRRFAAEDGPITVAAEPVTVHGESDRLERAVANLVDTAVKYGGGTPVTVEVGRRAAQRNGGTAEVAVVRVRDRGPGIAPEHLPHVFERFYRAPAARDAPGSGLGLSIVRQVAQAHGGRVRASTPPDGGTVMTLELPVDGHAEERDTSAS
ncbi:MAG TPA: HAMP domain-containing sensor histidine kinase [Euzebyales bacterium]|nr:HAMP domain-containing sensor histidine kinase [Euzebyales bacterium]